MIFVRFWIIICLGMTLRACHGRCDFFLLSSLYLNCIRYIWITHFVFEVPHHAFEQVHQENHCHRLHIALWVCNTCIVLHTMRATVDLWNSRWCNIEANFKWKSKSSDWNVWLAWNFLKLTDMFHHGGFLDLVERLRFFGN